jgi:hypothetical protein
VFLRQGSTVYGAMYRIVVLPLLYNVRGKLLIAQWHVKHSTTTAKTAAQTTDTTTDDAAVHCDISSSSAKALQCSINDDELYVMWCIRVWICVTSSRMVSIGVIAAVTCVAALSNVTPTCQHCNTGNTSGSNSSSSNAGKCNDYS